MAKGKQKDDDGTEELAPELVTFAVAVDRLLNHQEPHGEVYEGATADYAIIRAGMAEIQDKING